MYYTVIKHSRHLRTLEKCRKHSPAARVFYICLVFSNPVVFYHSVIHGLGVLYLLNIYMWFLGADIFLPHCLATGIENLGPRAVTGPKSWGTLLGTDALAPRAEVLRSFSSLNASPVLCALCLRMCRCPKTDLVTIFMEQYPLTG